MVGINVKFVGKKVNRVRFKPDGQNLASSAHCLLVSGSWDDQPNSLCLWSCPTGFPAYDEPNANQAINCLHKFDISSDIDDLCFAGADFVAVALASGDVRLFRCGSKELQEQQCWKQLHPGYPCTAVASRGPTKLASVGEDGRLCQLEQGRHEAVRCLERADSGAPTCLRFVRHDHVAVGNLAGHVHLWDLNSPDRRPTQDLFWAGEQVTCMGQHPSQGHLLASGASSGRLCLWDLRQGHLPTATLAAPAQGALADMVFEPEGALLFCASNGSLLRWGNPGLPRGGVELESLVRPQGRPLNSLDLRGPLVATGSDSEAIFLLTLGRD